MTKSTQQIADELAGKCSERIAIWNFDSKDIRRRSELIIESIPLLELLEVARAAKNLNDAWNYTKDIHNSDKHKGPGNYLADALTNLQKKVEL